MDLEKHDTLMSAGFVWCIRDKCEPCENSSECYGCIKDKELKTLVQRADCLGI